MLDIIALGGKGNTINMCFQQSCENVECERNLKWDDRLNDDIKLGQYNGCFKTTKCCQNVFW